MYLPDKEKKLNTNVLNLPHLAGVRVCRHWYGTPKGRLTLQRVNAIVDEMVADVFGYYALETGVLAGQHALLSNARTSSRFAVGMVPGDKSDLLALPEQLPMTPGNVDLIVASHVLDCAAQPHRVLREMERVLVAEGHCIIVGFNPFSWRGIGQLRYRLRQHPPPCRLYSALRIRDWLNVLGFEVLKTVSTGRLSASSGKEPAALKPWLKRWKGYCPLVTGSVYVIHAQKKVFNMTPLAASRKSLPILRPGMIANPGISGLSPHGRQDGK